MRWNSVLFAVLSMYPVSAKADYLSRLASYVCDTNNDKIIVTNRAGYDQIGVEMVKHKRPDEWQLFKLSRLEKVRYCHVHATSAVENIRSYSNRLNFVAAPWSKPP